VVHTVVGSFGLVMVAPFTAIVGGFVLCKQKVGSKPSDSIAIEAERSYFPRYVEADQRLSLYEQRVQPRINGVFLMRRLKRNVTLHFFRQLQPLTWTLREDKGWMR
jgi:hypothetical protein